MRTLVLVDGEHHPSAVRSALLALRRDGRDPCGALYCGGGEKVSTADLDEAYGLPVVRGADPEAGLREAIALFGPQQVLDMTDEPVLDAAARFRLASIALRAGCTYTGADFDLRPPEFARILDKPSVRVFATGKRTGKTALASSLARHAAARGRRPVVVAVGRGGPDPPRLIEAGARLDPEVLIGLADSGQHASSDYVEDAMTSGATTIGCVRVGGGLAGAMVWTNVHAAARMAQERPEDLVILEGSGASIPEVEARAGIVCVPSWLGVEASSYLNPYRLLLADLAVVTMAEEASRAADTEAAIHGSVPGLEVLHVVLRPEPLAEVTGRKAFFCSTAPRRAEPVLREHLERAHGCELTGMTSNLSDHRALRRDLEDAPDHDVLLVELKAAAVEVAVRHAMARGTEVVFVANQLVGKGVEDAFDRILERASRTP